MYNPKLFPNLENIPDGFIDDKILVEPLSIDHAVLDFEAVSVSKLELYEQYNSESEWPLHITLKDNIVDLGWHEKEFRDKSSFSYTILDPGRTKCFGCIYIIPSGERAELSYWVRADGICPYTKKELLLVLKSWISQEWPCLPIDIID